MHQHLTGCSFRVSPEPCAPKQHSYLSSRLHDINFLLAVHWYLFKPGGLNF